MHNVPEESDSGNEATVPQLNRDRPIHNEIRGGYFGGHMLAKTIVESRTCKLRADQYSVIDVQDPVA